MQIPTHRLVLLGLLLLGNATAAGRTITDARHGFTLVVPDRFVTNLPASGNMLYAFATSDPASGLPGVAASIERMHGMIGPHAGAMSAGEMKEFMRGMIAGGSAKGISISNITFSTIKWRGYDLPLSSAQIDYNENTLVSRLVQIPLLQGAVQIIVIAPPEKSAEADAALSEMVDGLSGTSNWDPPANDEYTSDAVMTGAPMLILIGLLMNRRKKSPVTLSRVLRKRHRRAVWICGITIFVVMGTCIVLALIAFKRGDSVYGPERQGYMIVSGGMRMSLWCGILAYGLTRLLLRLFGKSAMPPAVPAQT